MMCLLYKNRRSGKYRIRKMSSKEVGKEKVMEVVSRPRITPEDKTQADSKAQHTRQYVNISRRPATPPSDVRQVYEITSKACLKNTLAER
jgi:hypothetical protein